MAMISFSLYLGNGKKFAKTIFLKVAWKFFGGLFFGEHIIAPCVFGTWPRAFLSSASRGSVLDKSVLGLEGCVLKYASGFQISLEVESFNTGMGKRRLEAVKTYQKGFEKLFPEKKKVFRANASLRSRVSPHPYQFQGEQWIAY